MNDLLSSLIVPLITAFVTAFITWLFARKKNDAEALKAEIEANDALRIFYKNLLEDGAAQLDKALATVKERDAKIDLLLDGIKERDKKIDMLMEEVETLTDKLRTFKQLK